MAARRRTHKTKDLPPNLYCRGGYYSFRDPRTGKEYGLGRDKRIAVNEAVAANISILPDCGVSLVDKINNKTTVTFYDWIDKYNVLLQSRELKEKTISDYNDRIKRIKAGMNDAPICNITTQNIAEFIASIENEGKKTTAKLIRSLLLDIFKEAIANGIVDANPVIMTRTSKSKVARSRLSLSSFIKILELSESYPIWIKNSLLIAIVTGQRVSDISEMKFSDIVNGALRVEQKKTGSKIAIKLTTHCQAVSATLHDVIKLCKINNKSDYLISDKKGLKVNTQKISKHFLLLRDKLNLEWTGTPASFHEIRSLSARVYTEQFNAEYAQRLLGHKSSAMTDKYRDDRGSEFYEI